MSAPGPPRRTEQAETYYLERIEQLQVMADPLRYRIIKLLDRPRTGAQIARALELPRSRAHYHLKQLETAGLVTVDHLDASSGIVEKYYVCVARFFSFTRLLPAATAEGDPVVTAASYKAVADFLNATLEVSRDMVARRPLDLSADGGIWMEKSVVTTRARMAEIRARISALRDDILALERPTDPAAPDAPAPESPRDELIRFNAMLFLTPEILGDED
ncbi:MAG: ArsR/SmtB family transcription factor [Alkalilacustris sp.]